MIRAPHTLHFTSSYIFNAFQHLLLWLVVTWVQPNTDIWVLPWKVVVGDYLGFSLGSCCRLLFIIYYFESSNFLQPRIRSTSYIYKEFQHLLLWLVVIRMVTPTCMFCESGGLTDEGKWCRFLACIMMFGYDNNAIGYGCNSYYGH